MNRSIELTEFQIRRASDLNLENLPPELQDAAAGLLCTIIDATHEDLGAIVQLRSIASKLAPKKTRKDDYQRERPLLTQLIERTKKAIDAGPIFPADPKQAQAAQAAHHALEVLVLIDQLAMIDPAFAALEPAAVVREMRSRSVHTIAATLTVDSGAFGEVKPESKAARADAIGRVAKLSLRAQDA